MTRSFHCCGLMGPELFGFPKAWHLSIVRAMPNHYEVDLGHSQRVTGATSSLVRFSLTVTKFKIL